MDTPTTSPRYCATCVYVQRTTPTGTALGPDAWRCTHPALTKINHVSGERFAPLCAVERSMGPGCGPEGAYWIQKEEQ